MAEQKTSMGWRIVEIIAGIIVLALGGYAIAYPGVAAATLIAFLAVGLIILSGIELVRVFSEGISGWHRIWNLILSIIAFLLALAGTCRPAHLWDVDPRLARSLGVDLRWFGGPRTRHCGNDNRRHNRDHTRFCRVDKSHFRRDHGSSVTSDSPDHIRVNVDSIRHRGKMGVTHSPPLFLRC